MLTTLKVLGVVVLIGLLIVVGAVVWFIRFVRRAVKDAVNSTSSCPPCRVNPEPEPHPQWRNAARVNQLSADLRALGFEDAGAFQLPEMGGLLLAGFVHPRERLVGVVYDHQKIEPTIDICADYEDGTGLSATNSSAGDTLDKRPGHTSLWLGDVSVKEVWEAVQKHESPSPRKPIARDEFSAHFKKSYIEGMNWRLKKGGVSREEIRRQAMKTYSDMEKEAFEELIEATYKAQREAYLRELQAGCIAQFLDDQRTSAAEWERIRERAFAIPETMELKEITEAVGNATNLDEEQRHQLGKVEKAFGETALNVMDRILAQNLGALGLQKIGETKEPVSAYILLTPGAATHAPAGKPH